MGLPEPIDLHDKDDIPILARRLFDRYDSDALPFLIENCSNVIEFLRELHPHMSSDEREKARKILTLEVLAKFCHLAENFAAFAIAFKKRYQNEKDEINGIYNIIANYEVGQVMDFYKHIKNRDLQYIAHCMGYPTFCIQSAVARQFVETSCQNIKSDMIEIAELYDDLRPLYDAYKHGYRIAFATNEKRIDVFTYFDIKNQQNYVPVSKEYFSKIRRRAKSCQELFKLVFALHKERIGYEKKGSAQNAPIKIHYYAKSSDPKPNEQDLEIIYPSRGEILDKLRNEGNGVYSAFKDGLEENHLGKIVAIDIDEKKIIELDYNLEKVIQTIYQSNSTSRIFIRRVGKDERLSVEIY